jgi:hypothetical protein
MIADLISVKITLLCCDNLDMSEREVSLTVRIALIRDGTLGVSLSAPDRVLGEWQDSGAASLKMDGNNSISICGPDGKHRYKLDMPGTTLKTELLSNTEAVVVIRL